LKHAVRWTTLAITAAVAVAWSSVAPTRPQPVHLAAYPVANQVMQDGGVFGGSVPSEPNGRVTRWLNDRLVAAEREAAAQAAAQAQAQAAAQAQAQAQAAVQAAAAAQAKARAAAARSAPAPPAAVQSFSAGSVQDIITKAFTPYGATAVAWGLRVARCESGYNPRAYNPAGPYYGLFQFLMSTFNATPYRGQDIYDPVANAGAAAWKYGQGGAGAWGCN
jgi:Transglycosylase SLT domain